MTDLANFEPYLKQLGEEAKGAFEEGHALLIEVELLGQTVAKLDRFITDLKGNISSKVMSLTFPALFSDAEFRSSFIQLFEQLKKQNPSASYEEVFEYARNFAHNGIVAALEDDAL